MVMPTVHQKRFSRRRIVAHSIMEACISRAAQVANHTSPADLLDDVLWRTGELASAGDRTSDMATVALTI